MSNAKRAIVAEEGLYICPKCFTYIGSLFHPANLPAKCKHCDQELAYDADADFEIYSKKRRLVLRTYHVFPTWWH